MSVRPSQPTKTTSEPDTRLSVEDEMLDRFPWRHIPDLLDTPGEPQDGWALKWPAVSPKAPAGVGEIARRPTEVGSFSRLRLAEQKEKRARAAAAAPIGVSARLRAENVEMRARVAVLEASVAEMKAQLRRLGDDRRQDRQHLDAALTALTQAVTQMPAQLAIATAAAIVAAGNQTQSPAKPIPAQPVAAPARVADEPRGEELPLDLVLKPRRGAMAALERALRSRDLELDEVEAEGHLFPPSLDVRATWRRQPKTG